MKKIIALSSTLVVLFCCFLGYSFSHNQDVLNDNPSVATSVQSERSSVSE